MTITLSSKNQITIPKKIVDALRLEKGAMFDVKLNGNKIQITPVEVVEKDPFTDEEYAKMEEIYQKEKDQAIPVTKEFIEKLKKGIID